MAAFTEPAVLRPGDRLDRYELLCPLAYGGMAAVWLARQKGHRLFERLVVVKTILPQYASQEQFQKMFLDEARVAAAIEHPNVARTIDVGEQGDLLYIVMEWIDGESLSRLQRAVEKNGAKLPAGLVLRLLSDCCAGLHAAHELCDKEGNPLGVVHRDVSPQNVLVSTSGVAKLIDFGVAKARDRASDGTSAGQLKGKVRYMSPEQALGREVDRRADLWSLGAILYEMFAGEPPYDGPNEVAMLHKLTSGDPPPPLPANVPGEIAVVVERALAPHPDDRFATAADMQDALEEAMLALGITTTNAQVASFLEGHLGERAAIRKRSVDKALEAAARREAAGDGQASASGQHPSMQIALEAPSQTSTATLGSAAVEWPPTKDSVMARRRRSWLVFAAAACAIVLLVCVGAVAARVSTVRAKRVAAPPPPAATDVMPTAEITSMPIPTTAVSALPTADPMPPSAAQAVAPTTPRTRPRPAPQAAPPPPPKPPPPTGTGAKKRDYGF